MIPWYHYPQIELVKLRKLDFFPPPPDLDQLRSICIGSKTRTIGDSMMLATLPEKLKNRYPHLRVTIYPRGFNPVVFWNNPFVDGVNYMPGTLYGDDANEGSGHLIQLKEQYFDLPVSEEPSPKLYPTLEETGWGRDFVRAQSAALAPERRDLPLLLVHPFGHTWGKVMSREIWESSVQSWKGRYRVWQIGVQGHPQIAGCDFHFLAPKKRTQARQLFALFQQAEAFIGVNSGPMHVAKSFGIRSLVLIEEGNPAKIFENRHKYPYFLHKNWAKAFLYESIPHLNVPDLSFAEIARALEDFLFDVR